MIDVRGPRAARPGCGAPGWVTNRNALRSRPRGSQHAPPLRCIIDPLRLASLAMEVMSVGLQDELVGTFELVALESRRSDGDITHPYGEQPIGLFVFDATGRYSVQLTDPDRRRDESSYLATFGTYVVDNDRRTFILTPHGAADPNLIGTEVLRHVSFDGELAIFNTPTAQVDGLDVTTHITWRRVTPR